MPSAEEGLEAVKLMFVDKCTEGASVADRVSVYIEKAESGLSLLRDTEVELAQVRKESARNMVLLNGALIGKKAKRLFHVM